MTLHATGNVKVHFAGGEVQNQFIAPNMLGVRYALYTCFPFVERMVFEKPDSPIMALRWQKEDPARLIPKYIAETNLHCIQDSGLFTLMFGSQKTKKKDVQLLSRWYDAMVTFTLRHGQPVTCVELDCQRVLGVDLAWEFRERLKRDLPKNRIINVFHLPDGRKGLDRLIEFSDYIAISVPELRFAGRKDYVPKLARYIKKRKPSIDIHLLGCTELLLLKECRFATSADSTTWISGKKYGFLNGKHVRTLDIEKCRERFGNEVFDKVAEYNNVENTACLLSNVEQCKRMYEITCGEQDYYHKINV